MAQGINNAWQMYMGYKGMKRQQEQDAFAREQYEYRKEQDAQAQANWETTNKYNQETHDLNLRNDQEGKSDTAINQLGLDMNRFQNSKRNADGTVERFFDAKHAIASSTIRDGINRVVTTDPRYLEFAQGRNSDVVDVLGFKYIDKEHADGHVSKQAVMMLKMKDGSEKPMSIRGGVNDEVVAMDADQVLRTVFRASGLDFTPDSLADFNETNLRPDQPPKKLGDAATGATNTGATNTGATNTDTTNTGATNTDTTNTDTTNNTVGLGDATEPSSTVTPKGGMPMAEQKAATAKHTLGGNDAVAADVMKQLTAQLAPNGYDSLNPREKIEFEDAAIKAIMERADVGRSEARHLHYRHVSGKANRELKGGVRNLSQPLGADVVNQQKPVAQSMQQTAQNMASYPKGDIRGFSAEDMDKFSEEELVAMTANAEKNVRELEADLVESRAKDEAHKGQGSYASNTERLTDNLNTFKDTVEFFKTKRWRNPTGSDSAPTADPQTPTNSQSNGAQEQEQEQKRQQEHEKKPPTEKEQTQTAEQVVKVAEGQAKGRARGTKFERSRQLFVLMKTHGMKFTTDERVRYVNDGVMEKPIVNKLKSTVIQADGHGNKSIIGVYEDGSTRPLRSWTEFKEADGYSEYQKQSIKALEQSISSAASSVVYNGSSKKPGSMGSAEEINSYGLTMIRDNADKLKKHLGLSTLDETQYTPGDRVKLKPYLEAAFKIANQAGRNEDGVLMSSMGNHAAVIALMAKNGQSDHFPIGDNNSGNFANVADMMKAFIQAEVDAGRPKPSKSQAREAVISVLMAEKPAAQQQ